MKVLIVVFTLVAAAFVGVGVFLAWSQHQQISKGVPVEAKVLAARVEHHESTDSHGHRTTSYKPIIEYRYEVDGVSHTSRRVHPISMSSGSGWAHEIVGRYPVGRTCEAFYDPSDPAKAFLVREYSFFPYLFILSSMLVFVIAMAMHVSHGASARRPPEPTAGADGLYEIRATTRVADRRHASLVAALIWHGVGVLAWGHYFTVAEPPYGLAAVISTAVYEAVGFIPVGMCVYYHLLGRSIGDARVWIGAPRVRSGDAITAGIEQPVYSPVDVQGLDVALVCEVFTRTKRGNKTSYSSHVAYERKVSSYEGHHARPGESLAVDAPFTIPSNGPPSSPAGDKDYPRYVWRIEVRTRLVGKPDYRGRFPILVRPA